MAGGGGGLLVLERDRRLGQEGEKHAIRVAEAMRARAEGKKNC